MPFEVWIAWQHCDRQKLSFRQIDLSPLAAQGRTPAKMAAPQSDCSLYRARATNEISWLSSYLTQQNCQISMDIFWVMILHTALYQKPSTKPTQNRLILLVDEFTCLQSYRHIVAVVIAISMKNWESVKRNQGRCHFRVIQGDTNEENQTVKSLKSQHVLLQLAIMMAPHAAHTNVTKTKLSFVGALTIEILIIFCNLMMC